MYDEKIIRNYIDSKWVDIKSDEKFDVINPATTELLCSVPFSGANEVDKATRAASKAFLNWKNTPAIDRVQYLYKLKTLLETNKEELARTITMECGKTLSESRGELQRSIENVEVACGIPTLMQGKFSEDIAGGIDEYMIRQPVGVCACIAPFNFPAMIPFWFMPYAVACGNTYIVKPSEKVPLTMKKVFELIDQLGLPDGVVNLVNGSNETVDAILDHSLIKAISFVGSTKTAKHIYSRAAANGKRVQAQGGAKNPIIVLPDADLEMTTKIVSDSAFGCAGQRCLAASLVITVGEASPQFKEVIVDAANSKVVGYGLDENVEMGPVISKANKQRIERIIDEGVNEGAEIIVNGRNCKISGFEKGNFIRPTVLCNVKTDNKIFQTEIFGPVLGMMEVKTIDDAISIINGGTYGNMACLFTGSGANARKFRNEVNTGNVGINIGVAAPMAFFPFSGWRESFFGDLHAQGQHAIEFFTQTKVVIERWPKEWSRKF